MRVLIVVVVVVATSVVIAGWAFRYDLLTFKAYTDKDRYLPGETIDVTVKFTNSGFGRVTLNFATGGKASFGVYLENGSFVGEIPITVTMAFTRASLGPGESATYGLHWNQAIGPDHTQVPCPGVYYILAHSASLEFHAAAATAVFTISADSPS